MKRYIKDESLFELIKNVKNTLNEIYKTNFRCSISTDLTSFVFTGKGEHIGKEETIWGTYYKTIECVLRFDWEDYDFCTREMREQLRPDVTICIELNDSRYAYKKVTDKFKFSETLFVSSSDNYKYKVIDDKIRSLSK